MPENYTKKSKIRDCGVSYVEVAVQSTDGALDMHLLDFQWKLQENYTTGKKSCDHGVQPAWFKVKKAEKLHQEKQE